MMRRLLIGLLILGGVIAAIAVISRRRSGSGVDEWDSFAAGDTYAPGSRAVAKATDAAKDVAAKATDAAKDAAAKATKAAKDAAGKANQAGKDA
jgi:predicted lipid-binding transport protein (Tim44 family)